MTALLEVHNLVVDYQSRGWRTAPYRALKGVSLNIEPGECVGLVGESGSGKSTFGRAILGLVTVASGTVVFDGHDLLKVSRAMRREMAKDIQVIFQDPYSSLDPTMTIGAIIAEPLLAQGYSSKQASKQVVERLDNVGLPQDATRRLPREFSGGQRQRVAIARALALTPRLIICDEPVSALDLSTQARILDLLRDIRQSTGVAYLFISHDLGVVRHMSSRVAVMRDGTIVEHGDTDSVTLRPSHPYTRDLLLAAPVSDPERQRQRRLARQQVSSSRSSKS